MSGEITPTKNTAELVALTPYREMELTAPVLRGPSMLARVGAAVLPRFVGARWQWYRRALGGRWAREWFEYHGLWVWREWPTCPGECNWISDARCSECALKRECHCEVYP